MNLKPINKHTTTTLCMKSLELFSRKLRAHHWMMHLYVTKIYIGVGTITGNSFFLYLISLLHFPPLFPRSVSDDY